MNRDLSQAEIEMPPDWPENPCATAVRIGTNHFTVVLEDGRELAVPFEWFVRLRDAPRAALRKVRIMGVGEALSWPDLDEDMHVFDLLYPKRFADVLR